VLDDFVALVLIALVYGVCVQFKAWGFLAVFFSGVALRQTELVLSGAHQDRQGLLVPDGGVETPPDDTPTVSAESLVFKEHLERLSELTLVLLLGGMVSVQNWNWQTVSFGLFLFLVARPVSVALGLLGSDSSLRIRAITGWFGVRGIGSIYYLMYAINHGLPKHLAQDMIQLTIVVVMMSIILHGTTVTPLLDRFWPSASGKTNLNP
jgi:sodium/hydrogen antiporter